MVMFGTLYPDGFIAVRDIKKSDIVKCKFSILVASHYNKDGSCKCNDLDHRVMMIKEWGYSEGDFDDKRS
jgi:hypothetical protein